MKKNRILLIETPDYTNYKYIKARDTYEDNIKEFHQRYVKKITKRDKDEPFKIKIIGFDGEVKLTLDRMNKTKILNTIDDMPMSKLIKPKNLSLYTDYNKETTIPGLGFKDKEKALYTIDKIKNKSKKYKINTINTMLNRAKYHPHQTKGMRDAIKVFKKELESYL